MHIYEHASKLPTSTIIGYDLPRVYFENEERAKVPTAEWRPLKEVQTNDTVGLLALVREDKSSELVVFHNGVQKFTYPMPATQSIDLDKIVGVLDVRGTLVAAQLPGAQPSSLIEMASPPASNFVSKDSKQDTDIEMAPSPPSPAAAPTVKGIVPQNLPRASPRIAAVKQKAPELKVEQTPAIPAKRRSSIGARIANKLFCLVSSKDGKKLVLSKERPTTFGRDPARVTYVIAAPTDNQVSRFHASIEVVDSYKLRVIDNKSANGTMVNGRRVTVEMISEGDVVEFGHIPGQPQGNAVFTVRRC